MALKNYVDRVGPVVSASWLNIVDYLQQSPVTSTGTSTAYVITLPGAIGSVPFQKLDGVVVKFKAHTPNGASPTVNVGGTGPDPLTSNRNTTLSGNDFSTDEQLWIQWNAGTGTWNLITRTTYLALYAVGGGTLIDFTGTTLRLGGTGATWTAISMADNVTISATLDVTGADGNGTLLHVNTSAASASFGNLRITNSRAGSGSNAVLHMTNTVDANLEFRLNETGAATKFSRIGNTVAIPLQFMSNNTAHMALESSGRLVVGALTGFGGSVRMDVYGSTTTAMQCVNDTAASFNSAFWNRATSGNNAFLEFATEGSYTQRGSITYNRGAGLTAYNTTSDQRLKNTVNRRAQGIDSLIDQVQVHHFSWKDTGTAGLGCYAQELIAIAPEAVTPGDDNPAQIEKAWGVDYSKLVPRLILEIQSLRRRVAALESAGGSAVDDKAT